MMHDSDLRMLPVIALTLVSVRLWLMSGPAPLPVLDGLVGAWIEHRASLQPGS